MQLLVTGHGTGRRHSMHKDQPAWPSSTKYFWLYRNFAFSLDLEVLIYLHLPLDEQITYFIRIYPSTRKIQVFLLVCTFHGYYLQVSVPWSDFSPPSDNWSHQNNCKILFQGAGWIKQVSYPVTTCDLVVQELNYLYNWAKKWAGNTLYLYTRPKNKVKRESEQLAIKLTNMLYLLASAEVVGQLDFKDFVLNYSSLPVNRLWRLNT